MTINAVERRRSLHDAAAWALHCAHAFPQDPAERTEALKALDELLVRHGGWDGLDRDGRRLAKRYLATAKAHEVDLVAHARSLGLLSITSESEN